MTTIGDIEKGEENPSTSPKCYHGCLQQLSNYIKLLTEIVGLRRCIAIRGKLQQKVDLYIKMGNISGRLRSVLPPNRGQ
jgi:hypothetical protein